MKPNDRCSCGSGRKYKKCCWRKELEDKQEAVRQQEEAVKKRREERAAAIARGEVVRPDPYMNTAALIHILSSGMLPPRLR